MTGATNPRCDRCLHPWAIHEHDDRFACLAADVNGLCPCSGFAHLEVEPAPRRNTPRTSRPSRPHSVLRPDVG